MRRRQNPFAYLLPLLILALFLIGASMLLKAVSDRQPAPPAEGQEPLAVPEGADLVYRVYYSLCGHRELLEGGSEPVGLLTPPGITLAKLQSLLPAGWTVAEFSPGRVVIESMTGGLCSVCREKRFLGVRGDRIAIYRGVPPEGTLERVTEYEVKEDVRDQLEKGIPFSTMEELMQLLESYTS